jgi:hypothetical protein
MLDVHPPHEAAHTWKDFFIHVATICVGLLIAIGLEQTVEFFHHRPQAQHARELLAEEMKENRQTLKLYVYVIRMHQGYLFDDLPVIDRIRAHSLKSTDHIVTWHPHISFTDSAWRTIHESQVAELLSYDELNLYGSIYKTQENMNREENDSSEALMKVASVVYRSSADRFDIARARKKAPLDAALGLYGDALARAVFEEQAPNHDQLARLTPVEVDHLQQAIQQTIYLDDSLLAQCGLLQHEYDTWAMGRKP